MRIVTWALSILGTAAVLAGANANSPGGSIVPGAYIVELADGHELGALYDELKVEGIVVDELQDLRCSAFQGASFQIRNVSADISKDELAAQAQKILDRPSVKNVWPVKMVQHLEPDMATLVDMTFSYTQPLKRRDGADKPKAETKPYGPHVLSQVDRLHAAGYTGKGLRIAIIDTGIDYTHPALGGCFGEGCLVSFGHDFTGELSESHGNQTLDCLGHGTMMAGIIAAQHTEVTDTLQFVGVAPDAQLGMYKVSGCATHPTTDLILAGIAKAVNDRSDVISFSIGRYSGWATDALAVAVSRLVEAGVPIVAPMGNFGTQGLWGMTSPATGHGVIGVGSVDSVTQPLLNERMNYTARGGDGTTDSDGSVAYINGYPPLAGGELPVLFVGENISSSNTACAPLPDNMPNLSGYLVVVGLSNTDGCVPFQQAMHLRAKGAKNIMFYSPTESEVKYDNVMFSFLNNLSGAGVMTMDEARHLVEALDGGRFVSVQMDPPSFPTSEYTIRNSTRTSGLMSAMSGWGPTWEIDLKPQFSTPGGYLLSTTLNGTYAVLSGTSIATAYAAAIVGLVGQARGTMDRDALTAILSSTARPVPWRDGEDVHHDKIAPTAQQGGGVVQALDAVRTPLVVSTAGLSFRDSDQFPGPQTFSIRNVDDTDHDLRLGHLPSVTLYSLQDGLASDGTIVRAPFPQPVAEDAVATLSFDSEEITVPAGGSVNVTVTLTPPAGIDTARLPIYGGYITLSGSLFNLSVPYVGVVGSLVNTPSIQPGVPGCYLTTTESKRGTAAASNSMFLIPRPDTQTADADNFEYPKVVFSPTLGTSLLRMDLVSASDRPVPGLDTTDFLGMPSLGLLPDMPMRHVSLGRDFLVFNGMLSDSTVVPPGAYRIVVSALNLFGNESNVDDWTIIKTAPFVIEYLQQETTE